MSLSVPEHRCDAIHFIQGPSNGTFLLLTGLRNNSLCSSICPLATCLFQGDVRMARICCGGVQGCMQCCFSEEGLFVLKCHGGKENREGRLIIASYGGIVRYDLQPGEARLHSSMFQSAHMLPMPYHNFVFRSLCGTRSTYSSSQAMLQLDVAGQEDRQRLLGGVGKPHELQDYKGNKECHWLRAFRRRPRLRFHWPRKCLCPNPLCQASCCCCGERNEAQKLVIRT